MSSDRMFDEELAKTLDAETSRIIVTTVIEEEGVAGFEPGDGMLADHMAHWMNNLELYAGFEESLAGKSAEELGAMLVALELNGDPLDKAVKTDLINKALEALDDEPDESFLGEFSVDFLDEK